MVNVYGFWGKVVKVHGDKALFEFSHPSEPGHTQKMWVLAVDAGIMPKAPPKPPIEYTGGGIIGCHSCGNDYGGCECNDD